MRPVHVGVGHDHDLVIPPLGKISLVANARADRRDHAPDLLVGEHLVFAALVGVDDLASQRQNRLILAEPAPLGTAAGTVSLDQIQLAPRHLAAGAVPQLARQAASGERPLPLPQQLPRLFGSLAGFGGEFPLLDDLFRALRVLLEILGKRVAHGRIDDALDLAVTELGFGLPLELRTWHTDADHGS